MLINIVKLMGKSYTRSFSFNFNHGEQYLPPADTDNVVMGHLGIDLDIKRGLPHLLVGGHPIL